MEKKGNWRINVQKIEERSAGEVMDFRFSLNGSI